MYGFPFGGFDSGALDDFLRLEGELDQLLRRTPWTSGIRAVRRGTFPPINVGATADRVDVYVFAAGLDPKGFEISVQQNLLTIAGSRRIETDDEAEYYRRERFDGDFRRVITLPDDVDPNRCDAKYRDGVLQVTVQRREASRPRQITVN